MKKVIIVAVITGLAIAITDAIFGTTTQMLHDGIIVIGALICGQYTPEKWKLLSS